LPIKFAPSVEGFRALAGDRVLGIIYTPISENTDDFWCRNKITGEMRKGLSLEAAQEILRTELTNYIERRANDSSPASSSQSLTPRSKRSSTPASTKSQSTTKKIANRKKASPPGQGPCPVCGVMISNPKRHFKKRHPDQRNRIGEFKATLSNRQTRRVTKQTRSASSNSRKGGLTDRQIEKIVAESRVSLAGNVWIKCPKCRTDVREDKLAKHLRDWHGRKTSPATRRRKRKKRPFGSSIASRSASEKSVDATRTYASRFRENGKFGSHPSHDGFGEDDQP
jgi:hypothetical protein